MNLHRRHLTVSQRAAVAVEALPLFEMEAKERQGARADLRPNIAPKMEQGRAAELVGRVFGVGRRYIYEAKRLKAQGPDLFALVKAGGVSLVQARRERVNALKRRYRPAP